MMTTMQSTLENSYPNFHPSLWSKVRLLIIPLVALALSSTQAATVYTWTATTNGSWSNSGNWDVAGIPATDGSAMITFGDITASNLTSTIDSTWWSDLSNPAPVYGFTFGAPGTTTNKTLTLALSGVNSLSIGAGGITDYYATQVTLPATPGGIYLTADQTWNVANSAGTINTSAPLKGSGILSKTGAGTVKLSGGNGSAWTGHLELRQGTIQLDSSGTGASGAFVQLGINAMTWYQGTTTQLNLNGASNSTYAFATPIVFDNSSTGSYNMLAWSSGTTTGSVVDLSGALSGALGIAGGNGVVFSGTDKSRVVATYRLSGDNSGLNSPVTLGNGTAPFVVQPGANLLVANANALGANNTLGVSLGATDGNGAVVSSSAGLYAEAGMTVRSNIYSNSNANYSGTALFTLNNYIGTRGTGVATFSGTVTLAGTTSNVNSRAANTHLTASSGGKAVFTGVIADGVGTYKSMVLVDGGGTVKLTSRQDYWSGGVTVSEGTTLVVANPNGSATGAGSVYVGANARSGVAGTTTTGSTGAGITSGYYITGINTTGLRVGQTITSAGAGVSGTIVSINPNGNANTIQISVLPTTAGNFSDFSFGSLTGILGGSGTIRPTGANSIQVASGSMVYPGVEDGATATTLKLSGSSTTAPLLTMENGAGFTFNLRAPGVSDEIKFYSFVAGDMVLNSNTIHLVLGPDVASGTYKLFEFYSDEGTTLVNSGITSGLVLDTTGLGSYTASLSYDGNSISVLVVPEPSTQMLFILSGAMLLVWSRCTIRSRREDLQTH